MKKTEFNNQNLKSPFISKNSTQNTKKDSNTQDKKEDIWKILKEQLRMWYSSDVFDTWYDSFYLESLKAGIAKFSCDTSSKRSWIESNSRSVLKKALKENTGEEYDIIIEVRSSIQKQDSTEKSIQKINVISHPEDSHEDPYEYYDPNHNKENQTTIFTQLNSKNSISSIKKNSRISESYSFKNFIVGNNNKLAFAVAEAVSENPGKSYNPVFFYGGTGLGKTHLMHAVGNKIIETNKDLKVLYAPIEQFLNEMINSIRKSQNQEFRNKYREIDILMLDDIQALSNWEKTQEELFNTFNTLYMADKQIIMASDRPPKDIQSLTDRLRSRFEGGMVIDIKPPDRETRIAILQQIIELKGRDIKIPQEFILLTAENITNNVRQLEGAMTKIISSIKLGERHRSNNSIKGPIAPDGTPMTEEKVKKILQIDIESKRRRVRPDDIIKSVSTVFNASTKEIKGKSRKAYIALARQVVMFLIREELDFPLQKVAHLVNRKDHTTVIHACEKIEELLEDDEKFRDKLQRCQNMISV